MPHNTIIEGETVGSIESQINNYAGLVLEPSIFMGLLIKSFLNLKDWI